MPSDLNSLLATHISTYLSKKIESKKVAEYILNNHTKVNLFVDALDQTVTFYNKSRTTLINMPYLINAIELSSIYNNDLPDFSSTISRAVTDTKLKQEVFSILRDNPYFNEVWEIDDTEHLLINILILIYRQTVLLENKSLLLDEINTPKVQISSTLEEMICMRKIQGVDATIYPAIKMWIDKWSEEGFDERLYELIKEEVN